MFKIGERRMIMMNKNKKGISTIVATLVIILLAIVAVGVVWFIVNNVLKDTEGGINTATACQGVVMEAVKIDSLRGVGVNENKYALTVERTGTGDPVDGFDTIVVYEGNSYSNESEVTFSPFDTKTETLTLAGLDGAILANSGTPPAIA